MTLEQFDAYCASLPHATTVVQWGGAHVWKVGGKVFAIGGWNEADQLGVSFKCAPLTFEVLKDSAGVRPAPYLASRGMTWLQRTGPGAISDKTLKDHIRESHRLVAHGLPKRLQLELGLADSALTNRAPRQSTTSSRHRSSPRGST